jgi:hypothetical protein
LRSAVTRRCLVKPSPTINVPDDAAWELILGRIRNERCVPFLGAGASLGFDGEVGLPSGGQLSKLIADKCRYPGDDPHDFLRVAQYCRMKYDADFLHRFIAQQLLNGANPSRVHRVLAKLPVRYVLTTNFDQLMEDAFRKVGKQPRAFSYEIGGRREDVPPGTTQEPIVYKLHGSLDKLHTLVATEDRVIDFVVSLLRGDPPIPSTISSLFSENSFLFVGYGLKDWNVRVMLRALRVGAIAGPNGEAGPMRRKQLVDFALQRRPAQDNLAKEWEEAVMFMAQTDEIRSYDMDAAEFAAALEDKAKTEGLIKPRRSHPNVRSNGPRPRAPSRSRWMPTRG